MRRDVFSEEHDLLMTSTGVYRGKDGTLVRKSSGLYSLAGNTLISATPDTLTTYDLLSGKKASAETKWYRRGCTGLRACAHLATTRYLGNAAYIDLETRQITSLWNVRSACNNNLIPANGVLNVPNLSGGCECNYAPASLAFVPISAFRKID